MGSLPTLLHTCCGISSTPLATIFKRKNSSFWFACYADRAGKQVRRTTKTTDRQVATKMAAEWERVERLAKEGNASVATFQKVVSQVAQQVIGDSLPSLTARQYFTEWLAGVARKSAPATAERYRNTVRLFLKSLGTAADQSIRSLGPREIEKFLHLRIDEGAAPKTAIVDVKTLGSALRRAENYGYIDKNPVPAVKLPKSVSTERKIFTLDEIHRLVEAAPNEDWQTLIMLGFFTGARLGDCVEMKWDNILLAQEVLVYQQKKTGKTVPVPIHPTLLIHLGRLSEKSAVGPLCRSLAGKTPGGKHGLSEGFKRIVKRADLDLMVVKGKGIRNFAQRTFHSLRHSFSSELANLGVSEELRMRLTGHASRDIHAKYTHPNVSALRQAIDLIPARPAAVLGARQGK